MKKIASYSRYFLLSALVLVLAIFASRQAAAATCATVTPSMSTSQIQSAINNCPAGDTLEFAGGTYTITAGLTLQCGVTYTGPVQAPGINGMVTPTAVLSSTFGQNSGAIFSLYTGSGYANPCTEQTTIEYLSFMNSGGIYVQSSFTNLLIQDNNFGNIPCCNGPNPATTGIYFDGGNQSSNTAQDLTNTIIQWNTIGDTNSCLLPASAYADVSSPDGDGNAGGCGGMIFNTTLNGVTIEHNNFLHVSEGTHVNCPGGSNPGQGSSPCEPSENGATTRNLVVEYNDFNQTHRMDWEEQLQETSGVVLQYNSLHDKLNTPGFSFGLSMACCISGSTSPYLNVSNNVITFNQPPASGNRYGYGIEAWGTQATYNNNWLGVASNYATAEGITWGWDQFTPDAAPIAQQNDNTICGEGFTSAGYYGPEVSQSLTPSQVVGNVTSSSCSAVTSVAPTISPASETFGSSLTVTFTDPGYTSGPQPLGNTGIWYTTDGSTPVAGSHGTYIASGGTITISETTTVKAVGMWGAQNQPGSYASGMGFTPSSVVTATYTGGGETTATPVISPASESSSSPVSVTITDSSPSPTIHYTTNGTTPTTSSAVYTGAIAVNATTTVNAIATSAGLATSAVASATYTLPTLTGGYQGNTGSVNTLAVGATAIQQIAYGTYSDGSTHTLPDAFGNTAVWSSSNTAVLSVTSTGLVSCVAGGSATANSLVKSSPGGVVFNAWGWTCTGTTTTATPVISPASESSSSPISVTITDSSPSPTIHYTTNGTTPTTSSAVYTGPIAVNTTTTVNAIATSSGLATSAVASATYTLPTLTGGYQGNAGSVNTLAVGATAIQQIAYGTYSDGSTHTLPDSFGNTAVWSSSNTAVLSVTSTGLVSCVAGGSATANSLVKSSPGGVVFNAWGWTCTGTAAPKLTGGYQGNAGSVNTLAVGATAIQQIAYGTYSDGSTHTLPDAYGNTAVWSSSNTAVLSVTSTGLVSCVAGGSATANSLVKSSPGGVVFNAWGWTCTGTAAPKLTGGYQGNAGGVNTLAVGAAAIQQIAYGTYSDGSTHTLPDAYGNTAVWSSSNTAVLSVTSTGLVSCVAGGSATANSQVKSSPGGVVFNVWGWTCTGT